MLEENNTEKAGAEPDSKTDVKTGDKTGAEPANKDAKSDSSTENIPWNKDPRFQEFIKEKKTLTAASEKLSKLLKENELDDPDDLVELIQKGKAVKGKLADLNQLDTLIKKAEEHDQWVEYWEKEKERKRRESEDPEQTIARLEKKLEEKDSRERQAEAKRRDAEEAKQAIHHYDRAVKDLVSEREIPKEQASFVLKLCGVGNPLNDIDPTDTKAIKRVVSELVKEKEAYDQEVIKNYLKGKESTPKVGSAAVGASEQTKSKLKLSDARRELHERMGKFFGG